MYEQKDKSKIALAKDDLSQEEQRRLWEQDWAAFVDANEAKRAAMKPLIDAVKRESRIKPDFTYHDDPHYAAFFRAVQAQAKADGLPPIWTKKIYSVWYLSQTIQHHWNSDPSVTSENQILWAAYHWGWRLEEGLALIVAWWTHKHFKVTEEKLEIIIRKHANSAFDEAQKHIASKTQKAGREKIERSQHKLYYKVLGVLQKGPARIVGIAKQLKATPKAVESQIYRMLKERVVVRVSRGLYSLPGRKAAQVPVASKRDDAPSPEATPVEEPRPDLLGCDRVFDV